jgi:IPT/TIG domain
MRRATLAGLALVALVATELLALSLRAEAQVGNFCPTGPCNFSDATFVNVYWDTSPASWDADVGGAGSGRTQAQIDAFTAAIIHSTYFSQLKQYGVNSVSVAPSVTIGSCGTVPANVDAAINNIDALILCALTHAQVTASAQVIINVFLPPRVINTGFCNPDASGAHNAAMHGSSASFASPLYTIIPTTAACLMGPGITFSVLTHEMVEALTDPEAQALSGWKVIGDGEIGDLCQNLMTFPPTPYTIGVAQQYWSNSARACVVGFAMSKPPSVTSSRVCGTGQAMQFTFNGSFGPRPWDLASNAFGGQSLYVTAVISSSSGAARPWSAGNFLGLAPTVGFQQIIWTEGGGPGGSDQIRVIGFTGAYRAPAFNVQPGDTILFTITNPADGSTTTALVTAPAPAPAQLNLSAALDIDAGSTGNVSVTAIDAKGCSIENAPVTLSNSAGTPQASFITGPGGYRSIGYVYPSVGGAVTFHASATSTSPTVSASVTTRVHPRLDALVPARGAVAGGQLTVLSGLGFDSTTSVAFGGNPAPVQSVSADHRRVTLLTPAAMPAGTSGAVSVTATVHGSSGEALSYDYLVPDVPVMEFLDGAGSDATHHSCETGRIRVSAFDASGTLESTTISLSASYPALSSAGGLVNSLVISSGSIVTISGGGPITAVNTGVPTASATQQFPVWPADLCEVIKIIAAKVAQMRAIRAASWTASEPACIGDCGSPGTHTAVWTDAEDVRGARNALIMQGRDAALLRRSFDVTTLGEDAQRRLVAQHPALGVRSKTATSAEFIGPMIEIRARTRSAIQTRLPGPAHLTFASPAAPGPATYAIVHLRRAGEALAWIEDQPTISARDGAVLTRAVESPGIYALVRLAATVTRTAP